MASNRGPSASGPRGQIPESIDRYRIIRRIGRGGQGEVYLAHDPNLDLDVAIKVLPADGEVSELIDRFKVEARTAVRLSAPNIVRVFNFNPRYPYLVMEYCGDGDLNGLIKSRPQLPLSRSLGLVAQICDGLTVAHEHDPPILHRDLKPGNVLFQKGVPKVADFGLAKVLGGATTGLTATRGMMGTVGYASPEQLQDASSVDHRSDLWSVGVILYELLTYRRPFEARGDDYVNVAIKVRTEPPAPPRFELPAPVWDVVSRALQKDPARRFATAREMGGVLRDVLRRLAGGETILLPPREALDELDRMAAETAGLLAGGATESAEGLISRMQLEARDHSLTRYWSRRLRETRQASTPSGSGKALDSSDRRRVERLEERLLAVRALIERCEFRDARRAVGELLIEDPDNRLIQDYIQRISTREAEFNGAMAEAHAAAGEARGAGDIARVLAVWSAMDERFPGQPDVRAEAAVARREVDLAERKDRVEHLLERARGLDPSGDAAAALAAWEAVLAEEPACSEAVERVGALREDARREAAEAETQRRHREEGARRIAEARAAVVARLGDASSGGSDADAELAAARRRALSALCAPAVDGVAAELHGAAVELDAAAERAAKRRDEALASRADAERRGDEWRARVEAARAGVERARAEAERARAASGQLELTWQRDAERIRAAEAAAVGPTAEALAEYRRALAAGAYDRLDAIAAKLAGPAGQPSDLPTEVPALGRRRRRLNERWFPEGLDRFDAAAEAVLAAGPAERPAAAAELVAARARLLEPMPLWRVLLPLAGAVLGLGIVAGLLLRTPTGRATPISLISLTGEVRVTSITRDGAAVPDLVRAIPSLGRTGLRATLLPGHYEIRVDDGRSVAFDVPGPDPVLLQPPQPTYAEALIDELDVEALVDAAAAGSEVGR